MRVAEAPPVAAAPTPARLRPRPRLTELRWLAPLLLGALILRLWGIRHGLPYVYNADENAHFVPRAIGMFGHSYNPGYFINPPAFTYLLHVLFWLAYGGRQGVDDAFAADPTGIFTLARSATAVLGAAGVGLLWLAARELTNDRWIALLSAALLAVAFLPVHYSHFALNDVPAVAPLTLALYAAARLVRRGDWLAYGLGGAALGVACATKYTAGIVLLCLLAGALLGPAPTRRLLGGLALLAAAALAGFLVANPYALLDAGAFRDGLESQSEASGDVAGKLGLTESSGLVYYVRSLVWGFGLLPALAAAGGAVALLARDRYRAALLLPAPLIFVIFMGGQDRFFARWLLPVYPLLCVLAAIGVVWLAARWRFRVMLPVLAALVLAQGLVTSVHNDLALARDDTRQVARDWLVAHVPEGVKIVAEPISPDQWASDPGRPSRLTGNGARWVKWPTSRSRVTNEGTLLPGPGRVVKLEDYERTTRPQLVEAYARGGYCYVITGSTQYGRAFAQPAKVPQAIAYYRALEQHGRLVFRTSPRGDGAPAGRFSFDFSFNAFPLGLRRMGPEIRIYRLTGGRC